MAVTKLDFQQVIQQAYDEATQSLRTTGGGGAGSEVTIVGDDVGLATEATLSSLNGKVTAVDTSAVGVTSSVLPTGAATSALQTQPGVDIGDVTVNNAGGVGAVNIQDGGNSITVDGTVAISGSVAVTGPLTDVELRATAVPVATVKQDIVDFLDVPVLDSSSTNIPGSAGNPVEVVATLAAAVTGIKINDTIGEFVGVYTGAALSEMLQCIVGPGEDGMIPVALAAGERVSLRNMGAATLSSGQLCIQFLG